MFFQNLFSNGSQVFTPLCLWEQLFFICLPIWIENSLSDSYLLLNIFVISPKMGLLFQEGPLRETTF